MIRKRTGRHDGGLEDTASGDLVHARGELSSCERGKGGAISEGSAKLLDKSLTIEEGTRLSLSIPSLSGGLLSHGADDLGDGLRSSSTGS